MTGINHNLDAITTELFLSRRAGTLTPERYAELEVQALAEIDSYLAGLPEDARWLRDGLIADIRVNKPVAETAVSR
ncbi:hypothetical protein [Deinococcus sp.]|uniref:hypothetical protein n=1 Tax=Deinococcus sp. TaxID=47478 RepID=UPI003B597038